MPNTCVIYVYNLRTSRCITWVPQSTISVTRHNKLTNMWVNTLAIVTLFHALYARISTTILHVSPLIEQKLYPFSTEPITKTTDFKKGEY